MSEQQKVSVVIPAYNRKSITLECLNRLSAVVHEGISLQVIVVDDGSIDGTAKAVSEEFPSVTVLHGDGNLWWSGATNLGVKHALKHGADYILTLNDDVKFETDFLVRMLETAGKNQKAIVCCLVCYENRKDIILSAGRYRAGFLGYKTPAHHANQNVASLAEKIIESELESGYAMLIPARLFMLIGMFEARLFPHHMGDMDFVLRAHSAGFRVLVDTRARIYTTQGKNYLFNVMVSEPFFQVAKSLFNLRSNAYWKTRLNFMIRYTRPRIIIPVAFGYYMIRMFALLFLKLLLPRPLMRHVALKRYGHEAYNNQC